MGWYSIRSIYNWGKKSNGNNVFEERIVIFEGGTFDDAHAKAIKESAAYAREGQHKIHPDHVGYVQDGQALIDGYEVWSEFYESADTLNSFYQKKYINYEYEPE